MPTQHPDDAAKNCRTEKILNIVIAVLAVFFVANFGSALLAIRENMEDDNRIEPIDRIESRVQWNGTCSGLNTWSLGPYSFKKERPYQERWALSEYYAERFLAEACRVLGDDKAADEASRRAASWASGIGSLEREQKNVDDVFDAGIFPGRTSR